MVLDLIRLPVTMATPGCLYDPAADKVVCYTMELPWKDNQQRISCIPEGTYEVKRIKGSKKMKELGADDGMGFLVQDVPGRSGILFHIGNFTRNTYGCILPNSSISLTRDTKTDQADARGHSSKYAYRRFMNYLKGTDQFRLVIK